MDPCHVTFAEVDFEPSDEGAKLFLLVRREFRQLTLPGLQLVGVVHEVTDDELVLSGLKKKCVVRNWF